MRFLIAVLLAVGPCALAQFHDIAVTDDAGQIYLVSSVPMRGEANRGGGIYRWTDRRWEQFVPPFVPSPSPDPYRQPFHVRPVVSGGGTVVAWSEEYRCRGGSSCISHPTSWSSTLVTADGRRISAPGMVQISRNGRYVIQTQEVYIFTTPLIVTRTYRDLQTGSTMELGFRPWGVVSDGRVLGSSGEDWFLWSDSGTRQRIAGMTGLVRPTISDDGTRIVATRQPLTGGEESVLVAVAVDTGRQTSIGRGVLAGLGNDGLRALLLSAEVSPEAYTVNLVTGVRTRLLPGINVNAGALAGFGHFAVLATTDGRLLKVHIDTGQIEELLARTPSVSHPAAAAPCSAFRLDGRNLAMPGETPSVTLGGDPIPVLAASTIWVQIPCELDASPTPRPIDLRTASPFGFVTDIYLRQYAPAIVPNRDLWDAAHQDFSGPVTQANPAHPGEIVHVWGTGFGPVDRAVVTGERGPASPPAGLLHPIACRDFHAGSSIEVLFAGLAPGLVGFYQLDVRVPATGAQQLLVRCELPEQIGFGFSLPTTRRP